jgi:hypothetical protein
MVVALFVIVITGCYFLGLGGLALASPARASRFLLAHAATPFLHYLELTIRLTIGAAFLLRAPQMRVSFVFTAFGWILVATTIAIAAVPWRWHQRFAQRSVPRALRYLNVIAIASLALGSFILFAAIGVE